MAGIFLSYRRDDSGGHAGRLADDLKQAFASDQVWRDIEAIEAGTDFVEAIGKAVGSCNVLLAMIGPRWLDATNPAGKRRLDDPGDFVRLEIATALERGVRVIPVLVAGAAMPAEAALPEVLRPLSRRQAQELSDKRWDYDVGQLFAVLEKLPGLSRHRPAARQPEGRSAAAAPRSQGMPGWAKGMIGVIGAIAVLAVVGNLMNASDPQGAADSAARVAEQMATPAPAPAPAPTAPAPQAVAEAPPAAPTKIATPPTLATIAGTWMSPEGDGFYIEQQGSQIAIVAADAAQQHGFMGQGAVQGRQVQMVLTHLTTGINMEIRATLTEDGRRMQGTARLPATGATENFVMNRQ
jgi:hypothetical protein